jgi:hypothetical protein
MSEDAAADRPDYRRVACDVAGYCTDHRALGRPTACAEPTAASNVSDDIAVTTIRVFIRSSKKMFGLSVQSLESMCGSCSQVKASCEIGNTQLPFAADDDTRRSARL